MTACSRSTVLSKPVIPANLLEPCPTFSYLEGGTGKDALLWAVDTVAKGNECAARHSALVDAYERN
ncbi:Rz1-like lysis system protein LysC [Acinetobacter proteolyticus]|uniref:Rz1-like lysis system protein LysC n=1 Tax=Acinetobacter proteolyticus TaxID=1776741 RepID=UPI003CD0BEF1